MIRLLLLSALVGCAAGKGGDEMFDTATNMGEVTPGTLRFDVYPPSGVGDPQLLPQTHVVEPDGYVDSELRLYSTVTITGAVTGNVARGWAVDVPTSMEPIEATLAAWVDDTRLGASTHSDSVGAYQLALPAYDAAYSLAVVPSDAAQAPFHFEERSFETSGRLNVELDLGIPIYGRVTDDEGVGIPGVPLRLGMVTDTGVEVYSAPFATDATGWYVGRVESVGDYTLEVLGGAILDGETTRVVPSLEVALTLEDPVNGLTSYVSLGPLDDASADGTVLDEDGNLVESALVRFASTSLDGGVGSLEIEAPTASNGRFVADLMPGTYDVTVIAPYEVGASASAIEDVVITGRDSLGNLRLGGLARLAGDVGDVNGERQAGVVVSAKQIDYGNYVYTATTDADGHYSLDLPDGLYDTTFTPASADVSGALTRRTLESGSGGDVTLDPGTLVSGTLAWDGAPVAWAWIDVIDASTGQLVGQGTSDGDGHYRLQVHLPEVDSAADGR